jgi:sialate O-acetylesterase
MILQRDRKNPVWGVGADDSTVTVSIQDKTVSAPVENGKWAITLPALCPCQGCEMRISDGKSVIAISDVAVGEVWLAGGQSNMEFQFKYDIEYNELVSFLNNRNIRFFDIPRRAYEGQYPTARLAEYGFWRTLTPLDAKWFCAVGLYFQLNLEKALNVPVGIIGCNFGGSFASAWTSRDSHMRVPELKKLLDEYDAAVEALDMEIYEKQITAQEERSARVDSRPYVDRQLYGEDPVKVQAEFLAKRFPKCEHKGEDASPPGTLPMGPKYYNRPAGLWETMLKEAAPYGIRGVLWYQGEEDADSRSDFYDKSLAALIGSWRELWGEDFPFLIVQLAPLLRWLTPAKNFPQLRDNQMAAAKSIPGVFIACVMDAGEPLNAHPRNKRPVGERLALLARGKVYRENILCQSPEMIAAQRKGSILSFVFENAGDGLRLTGSLPLMIDGVLITGVEARDDTVTVTTDGLPSSPVTVYFAWENFCEVKLFNSAGLPAFPFKTKV